ncbi:response regulator, partial [Desulfovibrio sp. OttesenSCG-928-G15]|nr:response regulator [Desulfovibrio sp. OttesenSCG-928-G15]
FMTAGKNGGIGVIAFDITDRRALERDIVMAKDQAEASSRAKGDFLSRMSHEMRTPLNAVIGMTHIAKASDDPAKKEYCLDKIDAASVHLLGVINDILDMSKIEADKFELFYSDFSFEDMLRRVYDVINFRVEERKQALTLNIDPAVPAYIEGDEQHLAQVMTNLLSNAVKFTPDEGAISLAVRSLEKDGQGIHVLEVRVTDTGIGISAEQQDRLFTSFEQADGGISRKFGGTGLGLAISRRIVEMMGGTIWIESEEGKGATFIFTFKAKAVQALKAQGEGEASATEAQDEDTAGKYAGRHVLLAEDNEINREVVLSLLEDTNLEIDIAVNGAEAVESFAAAPSRYQMVFMDIHMPEVDGYEAVCRIRALPVPEAATVPIIAMTANVFREDIDRCLQCGMNGHIAKPIDPVELHAVLAKYLQ